MKGKDTSVLGLVVVRNLANIVRLPLEGIVRPGLDDVLPDSRVDIGDVGALLNPSIGRIGHDKVVGQSKGKGTLRVAEVEGASSDMGVGLARLAVGVANSMLDDVIVFIYKKGRAYAGGTRPLKRLMASSTLAGCSLGQLACLLATSNL